MNQQVQRRGRPKGSPNKSKSRNKASIILRRVFAKERCVAIEKLSLESGIGILDVIDDMAAEGLTVLREDVYAQIIKFRKRKGEVIHERVDRTRVPEAEANGAVQKSEEPEVSDSDSEVASIFLAAVQARERPIDASLPHADERSGQFHEDIDNPPPLIGDEMVEPHFGGEPEEELPL